MITYPQLSTGSTCQYPIEKTLSYRSITNVFEDGSRIVLTDPFATTIRWKLTYSGLTDAELGELRAFHVAMEGRLNQFTFLDPVANLLVWSEGLTNAAWQTSTLLGLTAGAIDPLGTQRATRVNNSTQGNITLTQTVSVPPTIDCCFSFYARSGSNAALSLFRDGTTSQQPVGKTWTRLILSSPGTGSGDFSNFGVTIPPGSDIQVFGFQVTAQRSPSTYSATLNVSGIYPESRFDDDAFSSTADAPNSNSCQIVLYSRRS